MGLIQVRAYKWGAYIQGGGGIRMNDQNEQITNKLRLTYRAIQIFSIYLRLLALKHHNKSGI